MGKKSKAKKREKEEESGSKREVVDSKEHNNDHEGEGKDAVQAELDDLDDLFGEVVCAFFLPSILKCVFVEEV